MKRCIYLTLLLFCSSHLTVKNAVADPRLAIEQLGCTFNSVDASGTVSISCSEKVLESEPPEAGGPTKCDPVKGKPETVTLPRNKGESNDGLSDRLGGLWDQKVAQQCKAHTKQKCSFFPGDENKNKASCVFNGYVAVDVTWTLSPTQGEVTATPECNYVCKACSVGAAGSASRREVE